MKRHVLRHLLATDKGAAGVIFAVIALPLAATTALSIDTAQLILARQMLQDACDSAALAGATVYTENTDGKAQAHASQVAIYSMQVSLNAANLPSWITGAKMTGAPILNATPKGYTVQVKAQATLAPAFMPGFMTAGTNVIDLSASATAINPLTQMVVVDRNFKTDAQDWDVAYYYPIPMDGNGNWDYTAVPPAATMKPLFTTCTNATWPVATPDYTLLTSDGWSSYDKNHVPSRCSQMPISTVAMPVVASTQPIGWALSNMTAGRSGKKSYDASAPATYWGKPTTDLTQPWGYQNSYGSVPGASKTAVNWFYGGFAAGGMNPAAMTDSLNLQRGVVTSYTNSSAYTSPLAATQSAHHPGQNCWMQAAFGGLNGAPAPGGCTTPGPNDTAYTLGSPSCAQIGSRTMSFYWNDGGDGTDATKTKNTGDDYDYNDLAYSVACTAASNAGTIVHLIQ